MTLKENGNALVATRDFAAGETVLTVPVAEWISPSSVDLSIYGLPLRGQEPWVKLCVLLMAESMNPSNPKYAEYIETLPRSISDLRSPVFWPEEELGALRGTQLLEKALGYRKFLVSKFAELDAKVFQSNRNIFPADAFNVERFFWAFGCVRMRTHEPLAGDKIALVPLADLVSHRRSGNVVWKNGSSGGLFGIGAKGGLTVEATAPIKAGDTLSMDFAPEDLDAQVALDYGTVDVFDRRGGVALSVSINEEDVNFDDKADILESNGLQIANEYFLRPGEEVPEEMLAALRLQSLAGTDAFLLEALFRNEVWGHLQLPVSEDNERAVCEGMAEASRSALALHDGSTADDVAYLRSVKPGSRQELAVVVRLGEREALEDCARFFEARLAGLDKLEYYQERRLKRLGLMDEKGRSTFDSFFKDSVA